MVDIKRSFQEMKGDVYRFVDNWNLIGLLILLGIPFLVAIWAIWNNDFTTNLALVIFTAIYTFVTFNQMREARQNRGHHNSLTIRPDFEWNDNDNIHVFGLRNFGTGPAINLRGCAIVREKNAKDANQVLKEERNYVIQFSEKDHHLSLEEGELLPLTVESHLVKDYLNDLWDKNGELRGKYEGKQIEFYYTFESNDGEQYPRNWSKPGEMDLETVIETTDSPRIVKLEEIEDKCSPSPLNKFQQKRPAE